MPVCPWPCPTTLSYTFVHWNSDLFPVTVPLVVFTFGKEMPVFAVVLRSFLSVNWNLTDYTSNAFIPNSRALSHRGREFFPQCSQMKMNMTHSADHAFCIYWSALAPAAMLLGQQREDMLIWLSACEGVSQKRSGKAKMAFHKRTYWFPIWMLGWVLDDKSKDKKGGGGWGAGNILPCGASSSHRCWWHNCDMEDDDWWRLKMMRAMACLEGFLLSTPLSSSVPHSLLTLQPTPQPTNNNLSTCLHAALAQHLSIFADLQDTGLR